MKTKGVILLLIFFTVMTGGILYAEEVPQKRQENEIYFSAFMNIPLLYMTVMPKVEGEYDETDFTYEPNMGLALGLWFNYKWITLSFEKTVLKGIREEERYGKTDYMNFHLNAYFKKFGVDGYYQ